MELPTKKSGISRRWKDQKFLMIGSAGIGKSDFWQYAENPLYVETEPGLNFIDAFKIKCRSWGELNEIFKAFGRTIKDNKFIYDVVIFDTVDRIVEYAVEEVLNHGKEKWPDKDIPSLFDWPAQGGGWAMREALIKRFLKTVEKLPCAVALIGHIENKKIEEDGSNGYDKLTISIGGKVGGDILAWADHTLHVKAQLIGDELRRTVYTKPTKSREAKSRGGIIKDGWKWSADGKENFNKLRSQFE